MSTINDVMVQRTYDDDVMPRILNANENHMALLLLLDTSGSMGVTGPEGDSPIDELNRGLNKFREDICQDDVNKEILDVAVVEFNSSMSVVQDFAPALYMEPVNLGAGGGTYMSPAIRQSIDMVTARSKFYIQTGTQPYKPWIFMISDGAPQDDVTQVASEIKDLEEAGKLKFFSLGVGNYDSSTLHKLSGAKVFKLNGLDFTEFFNWLNKSLRTASLPTPGNDNNKKFPALPPSVDKDVSDMMN